MGTSWLGFAFALGEGGSDGDFLARDRLCFDFGRCEMTECSSRADWRQSPACNAGEDPLGGLLAARQQSVAEKGGSATKWSITFVLSRVRQSSAC